MDTLVHADLFVWVLERFSDSVVQVEHCEQWQQAWSQIHLER